MALDDYYLLGRSGLRVSRLALGAMTFGNYTGWGADDATVRRMIDLYLDAGGNFIDTAEVYGSTESESLLGKIIEEKGVREQVVIATKYSHNLVPDNPNHGGNGRRNLIRAVDASLKRLRTDYIDLFFVHAWDTITPVEEVIGTLNDLVHAGKLRHLGLSDIPSWYASRMQTIAEFRGYEPVCTLQLEYSLAERNIEREFIPLGLETGMGIMVWGPLCSGLLSGKYRPGAEGPASGEGDGRLKVTGVTFKFSERNWRIIAELEAVSKELGRSMPQIAINWVTNRRGVGSTILGASKIEQLQDNLAALDFTLPEELRKRLDEASALPPQFPYTFFEGRVQKMVHGKKHIAAKPPGYWG